MTIGTMEEITLSCPGMTPLPRFGLQPGIAWSLASCSLMKRIPGRLRGQRGWGDPPSKKY
ncbi:MAG TPA: hypothetical protein PKH71_07325 [Methanoregulaceae archaeon]|nr:hypothetical protein [Methanoregulaceae archaeon]